MSEIHQKKNHLLTILVEDYFHVGAFENLIRQRTGQILSRATSKTL